MRTQNPFIGRSSGHAGSVVFSTLNGQNIVRSKPTSVKKSKSLGQIKQRNIFKQVSRFASTVYKQRSFLFMSRKPGKSIYPYLVYQLSLLINRNVDPMKLIEGSFSVGTGNISLSLAVSSSNSIQVGKQVNQIEYPVQSEKSILPVEIPVMRKGDNSAPYVRFAPNFVSQLPSSILQALLVGFIFDFTDNKVVPFNPLTAIVSDELWSFEGFEVKAGHTYIFIVTASNGSAGTAKYNLTPAGYVITF